MSTPRSGRATLTAFRAAAHIPRAIWQPCAQLASLALAARPPKPLRQWAINARVVTGAQPGFKDRYRAQLSWFRNTVGSLQLGRLTLDQIAGKVDVDPGQLEALLTSHAERGLVIAIPHMGSWDLAGAYGQVVGLPVTSVAERLPAGQYQYFSALRAKLGMQIYPYDQHGLVETLADDVHSGRVACLVADRDFGRHGLAVSWPAPGGARELTVPPGPVLIAQRTGADLVPIAAWFVGNRTHLEIGEPIEHRPGVDGAGVMAQQMVDFFATQSAGHVTDWHMMQRFFPGEMA